MGKAQKEHEMAVITKAFIRDTIGADILPDNQIAVHEQQYRILGYDAYYDGFVCQAIDTPTADGDIASKD